LLCYVWFIPATIISRAIDSLTLRVVGGLLIAASLCLDGYVGKVERVLRRRHGWDVVVCLDIRWHCGRLARQLRLRIPGELRNFERRQLLLPSLDVCQCMLIV
jgi:hypothetical protein